MSEGMRKESTGVPNITGILVAYGTLGERTQKIIRAHCERGNAQLMKEQLAAFMITDGIAKNRIPANAGIKTTELLGRVEEAIFRDVKEYNDKGGYLTAKGYASTIELGAEMAKIWTYNFSPPIPTETIIKGTLSDPEVQARLTLVAMKLRLIIIEASDTYDAETEELMTSTVSFHETELETVCKKAALEMFRAFQDPNAANHELIHGEKPNG